MNCAHSPTAGEADWQFIEPSIMGTLFERALDESQRSQLGAHYTSEADIRTLVEPVLMAPLRREWAALKGELAAAYSARATARPRNATGLAEIPEKTCRPSACLTPRAAAATSFTSRCNCC